MLVHEGKLAHVSFYIRWNDVVRDALVLAKDRKLARASFLHGGMMLLEMHLFLCKRES